MLQMIDDPALLMARVATGDRRAFEALVSRLYGPCLRVATRVLNDRTEAEDALQGALTKMWTEAARFDPARGSVDGWFRRILINQCLDRRRRFKIVAPIGSRAQSPTPAPAASMPRWPSSIRASAPRSRCFTAKARAWPRSR
jgi:RNA polymerase sigma-70 factor (ECF subfamily)